MMTFSCKYVCTEVLLLFANKRKLKSRKECFFLVNMRVEEMFYVQNKTALIELFNPMHKSRVFSYEDNDVNTSTYLKK